LILLQGKTVEAEGKRRGKAEETEGQVTSIALIGGKQVKKTFTEYGLGTELSGKSNLWAVTKRVEPWSQSNADGE